MSGGAMTRVLAFPMLPAALASVALAAAAARAPLLAALVALATCVIAASLCVASQDRRRRLTWGALAACALALAVRLGFGDAWVPHPAGDPLAPVRDALAFPLRRLVPDPESAILLGIVLGERQSIPATLNAAFARSGTTHLLAISGFNMTLVGAAVGLAARGHLRASLVALLTVLAVALYSVLVGLSGSVLRAALMAGVAALAVALGRPSAGANALCASIAAILIADPAMVGDVGFALSAAATAGLLGLQRPIADRCARLPTAIAEGLATTLAATLPTLPLVLAVFGRVSLIAPLANLVAVPLFPALMVSGIAASALGAISLDAGRPFAAIAYSFAFALRTVVELCAGLPGAAVELPAGPGSGLAAAALVAGGLYGASRVRPAGPRMRIPRPQWRRLAIAALLIVATAVILALPHPAIRVRALDIGQGDAFLIESQGNLVLIDGGPDPARLLEELGTALPPWSRRIDVVALTHAHVDHGAGLLALFERYEIGLAVEPAGINDVPLTTLWHDAADRAQVPRRALQAGMRVRLGDAELRALSPLDDPKVDVPSLVLRYELGGFSMLFMGDATEQAQADLLLAPATLAARVYVPPHHGAATPHAKPLVNAVRPEAAVLSVGANNRYGHPTPETLSALGDLPTYRTDRDGTVEIDADGARFTVRTRANGLPPPRARPVPLPAAAR
ncbi:MAG: ComEC/Rec2 family competence protein [Chloroflexi bacterium]|nr:ComEC/Rec2 family competence protein [Chloroflexota bacterium]